ncbi:ABC transporter substrate-binding protein [uncultured Serinicoccus sp.]|uniref:ABC transporter substrate-binding protein n=1 Tax=uncultured Serinicoccus sp. TaxID=735514 RepID=UPI0026147D5B|nr:sugar ABC transporter substrate-binding protein [uncultured Serinicoccus sp.]
MTSTTTRTTRILAILLPAALLTGACGSNDGAGQENPAEATGEFDWQRYSGTEIRVSSLQFPWQEAIAERLPEFEELTGITVALDALPEEQFRQRLQVEMTSGSEDIDVFATSPQNDAARFVQLGWYEDLNPMLSNESLTSPDYDFADFGEGLIESQTYDGQLVSLPTVVETQIFFYRPSVLEQYDLEVPGTIDELESAAATISEDGEVIGWAARGKRAAAVTQIASFLYNYGAEFIDEDGQAAFDTPEGVEAFQTYGDLLREYGPAGSANNSWEELLALFQQGQIAMWADNSGQVASVLDPEVSSVADDVEFAPMPAGPAGDAQTFFGWSAAISPESQEKGASWLFLQWATSPEMVEELQVEADVVGGRESAEFADDTPESFIDAFQSSLARSRSQLPGVIPVPEVRDAIGQAIVVSIEGGDVEAAVSTAAEEFNRIVQAQQ